MLKQDAPILGWFSGKTRRRNSSVFSSSTRASWYRPSAKYVEARLPIEMPRTERVIPHVNSTNTIPSHQYPDESLAKHVAETGASSLAAPERLGTAQVHGMWRQDSSLRRLEQNVSNRKSIQQTQFFHTCVRMVLRQNTSMQFERLLLQHQSVLVSPKCTVRVAKKAH
jgi:hypothetical protein